MCQFNNISKGAKVKLEIDSAQCLDCGVFLTYHGDAVYEGHNEDGFDLFTILNTWKCHGCQNKIIAYQEPCHDNGYVLEQQYSISLAMVIND